MPAKSRMSANNRNEQKGGLNQASETSAV